MQMTIILTRENDSIPWGFRLKGGSEYSAPLSILKVNEDSPAFGKLGTGDTLVTIGKFSALHLRHEEALHLIRMFDNSLPLVINRQSNAQAFTKPLPSSSAAVWRPPSQSHSIPINTNQTNQQTQQYKTLNFASTNTSNNTSQNNSYNNYQAEYQPEKRTFSVNQAPFIVQAVPVNIPAAPPPPPLPSNFNTIGFNQPSRKSYSQTSQESTQSSYSTTSSAIGHQRSSSVTHEIPDVLAKAMSAPGGGRKPFTYTPGGLDLSHIRQSPRVKRYESDQEDYSNSYQERQQANNPKQNQPKKPTYLPSNNTPYTSYLPKTFVQKQPQAFNISPEDLQRSKENKNDPIMNNQSFSFRMLNKWIQESESTGLMKSKKDEELEQSIETGKENIKSEVAKAIEEEESKKYMQRPQQHHQQPPVYYQSLRSTTQAQGNPIPSRTFQKLERKYSVESERSVSPVSQAKSNEYDEQRKVPARERDQENDIQKYKGASIPSKTFRFLQHLTQDDTIGSPNNNMPISNYAIHTMPKSNSKPLMATSSSTESVNKLNKNNTQKKVKFAETSNFEQTESASGHQDVESNSQSSNQRLLTKNLPNKNTHSSESDTRISDGTSNVRQSNHSNSTNGSIDRTSYVRNLRSFSVFETSTLNKTKTRRQVPNSSIIPSRTFRYLQKIMSLDTVFEDSNIQSSNDAIVNDSKRIEQALDTTSVAEQAVAESDSNQQSESNVAEETVQQHIDECEQEAMENPTAHEASLDISEF